jgi:hypothetical protein
MIVKTIELLKIEIKQERREEISRFNRPFRS